MKRPRARGWAAGLILMLLLATGCADSAGSERTTVVVSAASSLTDVFEAIEQPFEAAHPNVDVVFNFGGSPTLAAQVAEGAPADVLALANDAVMQLVVAGGLTAGPPAVFARNIPVIAVPVGNPAGVAGLADFGREDLVLGLCAEDIPCGALARKVLAEANVSPSIDTAEPNVRALLGRITAGELDAGIVYATDLDAAPDRLEGIPIATTSTTSYPIVTLTTSEHPDGAEAFVDFVLSDAGQRILAEFGFLSP